MNYKKRARNFFRGSINKTITSMFNFTYSSPIASWGKNDDRSKSIFDYGNSSSVQSPDNAWDRFPGDSSFSSRSLIEEDCDISSIMEGVCFDTLKECPDFDPPSFSGRSIWTPVSAADIALTNSGSSPFAKKATLEYSLVSRVDHENIDQSTPRSFQCDQVPDEKPSLILSPRYFELPKKGDVRFFVIKSYNEGDVCASFRHKVWSSTQLGNKRLSNAFQNKGKTDKIFLLFSVNGSGHFCGIAEMKDNVDFSKSSDIWTETTKWKGQFPIEWVFIKDVPNNQLKHLKVMMKSNHFEHASPMILKPVTNSRDTQELQYETGCSVVDIFKQSKSTSSFLQG